MANPNSFLIFDSHNAATIGDGQEKAARHCTQNVSRGKLANISNLPQRPRSLVQDGKPHSIPKTTNEYIEQLQKEKFLLEKMLAQRSKIIEQGGIELDRMKASLIKLQEQNQQLALSHTQMLVELNSGKDQLKALRHEQCCMTLLLKTRKPEPEDKAARRQCSNEEDELLEQGEFCKEVRDEKKPQNNKRRLRSHSLGTSEPLQSDGIAVNRPFVRRQSARFKAMGSEQVQVMLEEVATKLPEMPLPNEQEIQTTSEREESKPGNTKRRWHSLGEAYLGLGSSELLHSEENAKNKRPSLRRQSARLKAVESEEVEASCHVDGDQLSRCSFADERVMEAQDFRSSLRRPSRAKRVSYKELPINMKMRR